MPADPNFAIYFAGDAYSTELKIMGRQAAGKSLLNGVARTWPSGHVRGIVHDDAGTQAFSRQLEGDGFNGTFSSSRIRTGRPRVRPAFFTIPRRHIANSRLSGA